MRTLIAATLALLLATSTASCGGGGSPSPIYGSPAATQPATPLPSPAGTYNPGY